MTKEKDQQQQKRESRDIICDVFESINLFRKETVKPKIKHCAGAKSNAKKLKS